MHFFAHGGDYPRYIDALREDAKEDAERLRGMDLFMPKSPAIEFTNKINPRMLCHNIIAVGRLYYEDYMAVTDDKMEDKLSFENFVQKYFVNACFDDALEYGFYVMDFADNTIEGIAADSDACDAWLKKYSIRANCYGGFCVRNSVPFYDFFPPVLLFVPRPHSRAGPSFATVRFLKIPFIGYAKQAIFVTLLIWCITYYTKSPENVIIYHMHTKDENPKKESIQQASAVFLLRVLFCRTGPDSVGVT